jgi:DNA adenine methylase
MNQYYPCERCGKFLTSERYYQNHLKRKFLCRDKRVDTIIKKDIPKPFLKWVGGKSQIIDKIVKKLPARMNHYHELFVGGGSVLISVLWAMKEGLIIIDNSINVYDLNEALIGTYKNIQSQKDTLYDSTIELVNVSNSCSEDGDVIRKPETMEDAKTSKESYYYWIRKLYNEEQDKQSIQSSAYFIFLNKTGFRGMYREGPNGYNIPFGNNGSPKVIDKKEIDFISDLIQGVTFHCCDFSDGFNNIEGDNNFIYLDPPYAPENDKSFVGYTKDGFDIEQHKKLFTFTNDISEYNKIMMSNANVPLIKEHLSVNDFNYEVVSCRRAINSKDPGAKTEEVIITNY